MRFGDPIAPPAAEDNSEETYRRLTEELRGRVVEMWERLRDKPQVRAAAAD